MQHFRGARGQRKAKHGAWKFTFFLGLCLDHPICAFMHTAGLVHIGTTTALGSVAHEIFAL